MGKENIRMAFVIKTDGLEFDDRLRKEIVSFKNLESRIRPFIYVMLPKNECKEGYTSYGVPYKSVYISSRDKYPPAKKTLIKSIQFFHTIHNDLKTNDIIWCANLDTIIFVALLKKKYVVWDLHELPEGLYENRFKRMILKFLFNRCQLVIHANPQRLSFLDKYKDLIDKDKHLVIRNFPNFNEVDEEIDDLYEKFVLWKGNRKCVYLQGLQDSARAGYESISAVLKTKDLIAVVAGNVCVEDKNKMFSDYSNEEINNRIMFLGKVNQLKIPQYISKCLFTLVFYKNYSPNNYYCEANRFYQAVSLGIPVIVGNNPSMSDLVNKYNFGLSIKDDGRSIDLINDAILQLRDNYEFYKNNCIKYRENIEWNSQKSVFNDILKRIDKKQH